MENVKCLMDEINGTWIPKMFALIFGETWNLDPDDIEVLKFGPEHPDYDGTWDDVIFKAEYTDKEGNVWHLYQEGSLFAYTGNGEEFL